MKPLRSSLDRSGIHPILIKYLYKSTNQSPINYLLGPSQMPKFDWRPPPFYLLFSCLSSPTGQSPLQQYSVLYSFIVPIYYLYTLIIRHGSRQHSIAWCQPLPSWKSYSTSEYLLCHAILWSLRLCILFGWFIFLRADQWLCVYSNVSHSLDHFWHLNSGDDVIGAPYFSSWTQEDGWGRQRSDIAVSNNRLQSMWGGFGLGGNQ